MKLLVRVRATVGQALERVERLLEEVLSATEGLGATTSLHLLRAGGKRIRPLLTLLSARIFGGRDDDVVPIAAAAEMIHMATLVHDDVIDHAPTRRGRPTVNAIWGNYPAVLTGDFMLARAMSLIVDQGNPRVLKIMSDMIYEMCEGEIAQHQFKGRLDQTQQDYFRRIGKKTARFFQACCESGAILGGASSHHVQAMGVFGYQLGMAFQVVDDLLDVVGDEVEMGKPAGSDLAEGVFTLPVLYLLEQPAYRERVAELLREFPPAGAAIRQVLRMVRDNGAVRYTEEVARRFIDQALAALGQVPDGVASRLLRDITLELAARRT
ncbi:MAG TPA: polyprenyl synthetase family protein [Limnochordales bacterium]